MVQAFSEQYAGCERSAFAVARGVLGDFDAAEEAVQEAACRAWRSAAQFDGTRPFRPWFLRIVRNTAVNELRRRMQLVRIAREPDDAGPAPADVVVRNERTREVIRALDALPHHHRSAIVLRGVHDLDYKQIAAVLGIPSATARIHVYRARRSLRNL